MIAVKKRNRIIALVLAAIVFFTFAFSVCVIATEAGHDCHGENCPICEIIAICENNIKGLSLILVFVSLMVALALLGAFIRETRKLRYQSQTPVSLKVKLTN